MPLARTRGFYIRYSFRPPHLLAWQQGSFSKLHTSGTETIRRIQPRKIQCTPLNLELLARCIIKSDKKTIGSWSRSSWIDEGVHVAAVHALWSWYVWQRYFRTFASAPPLSSPHLQRSLNQQG